MQADLRLYKYVGETSRSLYERSFEHLTDYENLSTKSHLLKHTVEMHPGEELDNIKFGIRIVKTAKSSFERQIFESVEIQENRHHHLLNSRSEYNRCAVPRLMCKLGDAAYKKYEKETEQELAKEETIMSKIRQMRKDFNRRTHQTRAPPPKRRKTGEDSYICEQEQQKKTSSPEKRRQEENPSTEPQPKKSRREDIREFMKENEKVEAEKEPESVSGTAYGDYETGGT